MTYETTTTSSAATVALAKQIGARLRGGEFIELVADVGGGKTTFVRGLVEGLGYSGAVTSPTFTISRLYEVRDGLHLYHYDFYRLHARDMATAELAESLADPRSIAVVEWGEQLPDLLPDTRMIINLTLGDDEDERRIEIQAASSYRYIIEGLAA